MAKKGTKAAKVETPQEEPDAVDSVWTNLINSLDDASETVLDSLDPDLVQKIVTATDPDSEAKLPESHMTPIIKTKPKPKPNAQHTMPANAAVILSDILKYRGWDQRIGQTQMTDVINDAVHDSSDRWSDIDIAVNAPVGTGKTLAYLIACIANGMRVVVATSTKGLQDQIMQEELPKLAADLLAMYNYTLTYGVLKGKSNYACSRSVKAMLSGDGSAMDEDNQLFSAIDLQPDVNDISTLEAIDARATLAKETRDSLSYDSEHLLKRLRYETQTHVRASKRCAGKSEPWVDAEPDDGGDFDDMNFDVMEIEEAKYEDIPAQIAQESDCVYRSAYAHAMDSQIVVVNTTLLIYEIMRANSPMGGELKPSLIRGVGMVIVDEAHHLFANISEAYSVDLDFGALKREAADIAKRLNKRYSVEGEAKASFDDIIDIVENAEKNLDDIIDDDDNTETEFRKQLNEELNRLAMNVKSFSAKVFIHAIQQERKSPSGGKIAQNGVPKVVNSLITNFLESMDGVMSIATKIVQGATKEGKKKVDHYNSLSYSDGEAEHLTLKTVPIDVGFFRSELAQATKMPNPYVPFREDTRSVVTLSSGTITKNTPIVVGMEDPIYLDVETPFDPKKVRVFVPMMSAPSAASWRDEAWDEMLPAILKVGGRTLSLHTSTGKVNEFTEMARRDLEPKGFTIFTQNSEMSKLELIEALRTTPKSVLFGTRSFWEGVDIQGEALSLVILDKIPFPNPDDAMFEARREFIKKRHSDPTSREASTQAFMNVDVDFASVMLAQGTGRLIRATGDVGGIMILDHRVLIAGYAGKLKKLLPAEWAVTREQKPFMEWLTWVNPDTREGPMPKVNSKDTLWEPMRKSTPDVRRQIKKRN